MTNEIILQSMSREELRDMMQEMVRTEFQIINKEIQRVIGEDDLVSTGTACRILGVSSKVLKVLIQQGHFNVFAHIHDRRFSRGELLSYRNAYRINKIKH